MRSKSQKSEQINSLRLVFIWQHVVSFLRRSNLGKVYPEIFEIERLQDEASTGAIKLGTTKFDKLTQLHHIAHFKCDVTGEASLTELAKLNVSSLALTGAYNLTFLLKMMWLETLILTDFKGIDLSPILSLMNLRYLKVDSHGRPPSQGYVYAHAVCARDFRCLIAL
jgi:hypothetical protein